MQLEILTPDKTLFSGEVNKVTFPGADGEFQILINHASLVASLKAGEIRIDGIKGEEKVYVNGGVVEVLNNKIVVLA